jgi:hypothetical protein
MSAIWPDETGDVPEKKHRLRFSPIARKCGTKNIVEHLAGVEDFEVANGEVSSHMSAPAECRDHVTARCARHRGQPTDAAGLRGGLFIPAKTSTEWSIPADTRVAPYGCRAINGEMCPLASEPGLALAPPTLRERCHRDRACRLIAVGRRVSLMVMHRG